MHDQAGDLEEQLLQAWQFRRQMIDYSFRALLHLPLDDRNTSQRWRELNDKLSIEMIALTHASDQLQSAEQERVLRESEQN